MYQHLNGWANILHSKKLINILLTVTPSWHGDEQLISPNFYANGQSVFWNKFSFHHCRSSRGFVWIGKVQRSPEKSF